VWAPKGASVRRVHMNLRQLSPLALLLALSLMTACSSSDDGAPITPDSATDSLVAEGGAETSTFDSAIDSGPSMDSGVAEETSSDADPSDATESETDAATSEAGDGGGACKSGAIEEEKCGKCGTRARLCSMGKWLDYSACSEETGVCVPGETRNVPCDRCGTRKQTCTSTCEWTSGACLDQKGCIAGSVETRYGLCLDSSKVQTRTCTETCSWSAWGECS